MLRNISDARESATRRPRQTESRPAAGNAHQLLPSVKSEFKIELNSEFCLQGPAAWDTHIRRSCCTVDPDVDRLGDKQNTTYVLTSIREIVCKPDNYMRP